MTLADDQQIPAIEPSEDESGSHKFNVVRDVLSDEALTTFIGTSPRKQEYYRGVFQTILEKTGLLNRPIDGLTPEAIRSAFNNSHSSLFRNRLPFRKDTVFNWAAFFFSCYWLVWRRASLGWFLFCGYMIAVLISDFVSPAVFSGVAIAFAVLCGDYGNELVLHRILREITSNNIRKKPTNRGGLIAAIIIFLSLAGIQALADDGNDGSAPLASRASTKRDILGVYPGMSIAEAKAVTNKWACGVGYTPSTIENYSCIAPGGRIYVLWGSATQRVFQVEFHFDAGGNPDDVARQIGQQFNTNLRREPQANAFMFRTYKTALSGGVMLELNLAPSSPSYRMTLLSPTEKKADELAAQREDQRRKPTPRF